MKKLLLLFAAIVSLSLASCQKETIKGSGNIVTETRSTGTFTNIETEGDPKIFISYGPTLQVTITGYDNLLPLFETKVSNNTLKARYKEGTNVKNSNIEVHIIMPVLTGLQTNGSVQTQIAGNFPYTQAISFKVNGSGTTIMESGTTGKLNVETSGSATYNLLGLQAQEAEINIAGSGEVKAAVAGKLKAKIEGSGKLYYQGNPTLELDVNGSGKVTRL